MRCSTVTAFEASLPALPDATLTVEFAHTNCLT